MNYRHHFHAGNFADVMKHALLVRLVRAMQRKEKGLLALDTHAGRGAYELAAAARGDSLARRPEHPDGIGRLLARDDLPGAVADYVALVRQFDRVRRGVPDATAGDPAPGLDHYPGSPRLLQLLARPQDRLVLCERQPDEHAALAAEMGGGRRVEVRATDGYGALRALLPPPERRALVLMDPPFEEQDEFARITAALGLGLRRMPGAVVAIWYPLTERARVDAFFGHLRALHPPPTLAVELTVAGERSTLKMRGCGLVVVNPPWRLDREAEPELAYLARVLAQEPGGGARFDWLVPER